MEKKSFETEKPQKSQVILFKARWNNYPEVGIFEVYDDGVDKVVEEVYVPANDDVSPLEQIIWWCEIPE